MMIWRSLSPRMVVDAATVLARRNQARSVRTTSAEPVEKKETPVPATAGGAVTRVDGKSRD